MNLIAKNTAQSKIIHSVCFGSDRESEKILRNIKPHHLSGKAQSIYEILLTINTKGKDRFLLLCEKLESNKFTVSIGYAGSS